MSDETLLAGILKRLDVLILLELEKPLGEKATPISERIERLDSIGLAPSAIAGIMGKRTNYVTAALSRKRSGRPKGRPSKK